MRTVSLDQIEADRLHSRQTGPLSVRVPASLPLRLFGRYTQTYLRRHFHSLRVLSGSLPNELNGLPLVVYLNHSSWWDPLVCLLLARQYFPQRHSFAPIEASALRRYQFLRRLGFFGVETGTLAGAKDFLANADAILRSERNALWITPEGKFTDCYARPMRLQRGISHLTQCGARAGFVPLALQYVFWEERLPEILVAFGEPIVFESEQALGIAETTRLFESALTSVQDHLAAASQRRQSADWHTTLDGGSGTNFVYDAWRKTRARLRGEKFNAAHSDL